MLNYFLRFIGLALVLPLLVVIGWTLVLPVTVSWMVYILGAGLYITGLVLAPRVSRYYIIVISGISIVILMAGTQLVLSNNPNNSTKVLILPEGEKTFWLNTLLDEQDSLIIGEALFHLIGADSDREHADLAPALASVYSEMRKDGRFASPVLSTYLNLQTPDHFDAVISEPDSTTQFGVVFLHGYMGNVTAQCWVIAQAVKELGGLTICPSTVWTGEWWRPEGQAILQSTFEYLRSQGIHKFYLGGFSNGGFSIGRLASPLADEKDLSGLIFIDGFINGKSIRELGLPVLIIQGVQDERVSVEAARQFAEDVGDLVTYVEINSDHFVIMKESGLVQNGLAAWLEDQEAGR